MSNAYLRSYVHSGCPDTFSAYADVYLTNETVPRIVREAFVSTLFQPDIAEAVNMLKDKKGAKYFLLGVFEDGCDGFPFFGKSRGLRPEGVNLVLYGEIETKSASDNGPGVFIRCEDSTEVEIGKKPKWVDLRKKFRWSVPKFSDSCAADEEITQCPVCRVDCTVPTVIRLSDLVYRSGSTCKVGKKDEAFSINFSSSEEIIFQALFSTSARSSEDFVVAEESDHHAIVKATSNSIVRVFCREQLKSVDLEADVRLSRVRVNGVERRYGRATYCGSADLARHEASRMFHFKCWKDQQQSFLEPKFKMSGTHRPIFIDCMACSKAECKPFATEVPPSTFTVIFDLPLYHQALPMFLVWRKLHSLIEQNTDENSLLENDGGGSSKASAKRRRISSSSVSNE